ncbi:hypothetical protein V5O48_014466 [Marasmius crinis-equi]|uniref:Glucose-methanol-choline oxidoreductase N-terminal domain-containing protein n=1 Tax=Marasmius crinis-equi TaxID=585013 RepID=A0ABR3EXB5_9AGAR
MNFCNWSLPPAEDINDWERLGNKGWNWKTYENYHSKVATYVPLDVTSRPDVDLLKIWDLEKHSSGSGPLLITHPRSKFEIDRKAYEAYLEMGMPKARNPPKGAVLSLNSVDPKSHLRTYAATAYYEPVSTRPNLSVLPTAYAHRLDTTGEVDGDITATGVVFSYGGGKTVHVANARREVILSAGSLKSPQILELSGIGRKDVLSKIDVPVKVSLAGVGENVQEHFFLCATYELREDTKTETFDVLRDEKEVLRQVELLSKGEGVYTSGLTNIAYLPLSDVTPRADALYAQESQRIAEDVRDNVYPPGLIDQYTIQLERGRNKALHVEIADVPGFMALDKPPIPGKKYLSLAGFLNHTFSRGTIHSKTKDPFADPDMDPHYWEHEIDRLALIEVLKYARKIAQTSSLRDEIAVEYSPGPEIQSDEQLAEWAHKGLCSTFHTAGSCSMLPREKNGVVDTHLKVYGTKNIRVVDLSIVPLHFAAHTQATVYTIAEIASDIIKGEFQP